MRADSRFSSVTLEKERGLNPTKAPFKKLTKDTDKAMAKSQQKYRGEKDSSESL